MDFTYLKTDTQTLSLLTKQLLIKVFFINTFSLIPRVHQHIFKQFFFYNKQKQDSFYNHDFNSKWIFAFKLYFLFFKCPLFSFISSLSTLIIFSLAGLPGEHHFHSFCMLSYIVPTSSLEEQCYSMTLLWHHFVVIS